MHRTKHFTFSFEPMGYHGKEVGAIDCDKKEKPLTTAIISSFTGVIQFMKIVKQR